MDAFETSLAWAKFTKSLGSKSMFTKRYYEGDMKRFIAAAHVSGPDELLLMSKDAIQERITNYIIGRQESEGIRGQSLIKEMSSIRKFFVHNDRTEINWTIIKGYIKAPEKAVRDRAYTTEEIQRMLEYADYRTRVVILLMSSSGMRLGAIPEIRLKHLDQVKDESIYAIVVYEKTVGEYITYCTPECKAAIDGYLDYRQRAGEILKPGAPLIREQFDGSDKFKVLNPQPLERETVSSLIKIVAYKAGLRQKNANNRFERKETMLNHGLRKFFFRACGRAKIDPVVREYLMGHKIGDIKTGVTKLMMTYEATEDNEVLTAYKDVINYLTINDEYRLKTQLKQTEQERDTLRDVYEAELRRVWGEIEKMKATTLGDQSRGA